MRSRLKKPLQTVVYQGFKAWLEDFLGGDETSRASAHPMRQKIPAVFVLAVVLWAFLALFLKSPLYQDAFLNQADCGIDPGWHTFEMLEDMKQTEFGWQGAARVLSSPGSAVKVQVVSSQPCAFIAHEKVCAQASFRPFSEASKDGYFERGLAARASLSDAQLAEDQGSLWWVVRARKWAAGFLDEAKEHGASEDGIALLKALLVGDRSSLDQGMIYQNMKIVGLAHMVAVSGAHLSIIAGMLLIAFGAANVPKRVVSVALMTFYGCYAVFTGLSVPVVRAGVMAACVVGSAWGMRRSSSLAALGVCVCVMLAADPFNALSVSFFLSVASTAGIIVFTPLFSSWFCALLGNRFETVAHTCAMTTAANFAIFPVSVLVFARIAIIAPLSNLLAAPFFSVLLVGGLAVLGVSAVVPGVGCWCVLAFAGVAQVFIGLIDAMAMLPLASVACSGNAFVVCGGTLACVLMLLRWWPKAHALVLRVVAGCLAGLFALSVFLAPLLQQDEIVMLDVGQGDAILIKSKGAAFLVDTGNRESLLLAGLARCNVTQLDGLLITHHDDDHSGCMKALKSFLCHGNVYVAQDTFSCGCESCKALVADAVGMKGAGGVSGVAVGDCFVVGSFTCQVVWPDAFSDEGGNADSVCLLVEHDANADGCPDGSAFLCGDAEADQVKELLDLGRVGPVDVCKIGHHGSKASVRLGEAKRLDPAVSLLSVGAGNRYGHPSAEAVDVLGECQSAVVRTDEAGDAHCIFLDGTLRMQVQYPYGKGNDGGWW